MYSTHFYVQDSECKARAILKSIMKLLEIIKMSAVKNPIHQEKVETEAYTKAEWPQRKIGKFSAWIRKQFKILKRE